MKKFFALSLAAVLALGTVSCGSEEAPAEEAAATEEATTEEAATEEAATEEATTEEATTEEAAAEGALTDGTFEGQVEEEGTIYTATVTVAGGAITEVFFDEIKDGASVREVPVETTTENATVGAQLDALAQGVVDTQNTLVVNGDGLADGITGCTMQAQVYIDAVNAALAQ